MQAAVKTKKPRKQAVSGRFWATRTYRGRIKDDHKIECACGTGAITVCIAGKCNRLVATDFATGMLKQAARKCRKYGNVSFKHADITNIKCKDAIFLLQEKNLDKLGRLRLGCRMLMD